MRRKTERSIKPSLHTCHLQSGESLARQKHGLCGKGSVWKRGWEQNCEKGLENQLRNLGFIQYAGGAKKRLDSVNCAF